MAEEKPSKNDLTAIFKRLRSFTCNKTCFDCGAKNPTWASVTYGVFICMDCSAVHRSLGVHLSFVRSTQLDTSWNWLQVRAMQVGGNSNAHSFFSQHGCGSKDAQQKYNSRAAQLYRDKLHNQATSAMRLHGTKLHIETPHADQPSTPEVKDHDFFQVIEAHDGTGDEVANGSCFRNTDLSTDLSSDFSLEFPSVRPNESGARSHITGRKPTSAKKGLGGKKGLGAQRLATNFDDLAKEAEKMDRLREQAKTEVKVTPEAEEKQIASVRLAYKDLGLEQKKTEEKLRQTDPKKAEQLERLGMGFGGRNANVVCHSAASEMKLITDDAPASSSQKHQDADPDDEYDTLGFALGPPKYGDSPFGSRESAFRPKDSKLSFGFEKSEPKSAFDSATSLSASSSGRAKKSASTSNLDTSDEAQKKFGNAKGISSDQFFGNSNDNDYERRANLNRFEGSSSISSEDFFGEGRHVATAGSFTTPNLYEIREGVREGVTKVAGRLSSIANGVMSSLQRK